MEESWHTNVQMRVCDANVYKWRVLPKWEWARVTREWNFILDWRSPYVNIFHVKCRNVPCCSSYYSIKIWSWAGDLEQIFKGVYMVIFHFPPEPEIVSFFSTRFSFRYASCFCLFQARMSLYSFSIGFYFVYPHHSSIWRKPLDMSG